MYCSKDSSRGTASSRLHPRLLPTSPPTSPNTSPPKSIPKVPLTLPLGRRTSPPAANTPAPLPGIGSRAFSIESKNSHPSSGGGLPIPGRSDSSGGGLSLPGKK